MRIGIVLYRRKNTNIEDAIIFGSLVVICYLEDLIFIVLPSLLNISLYASIQKSVLNNAFEEVVYIFRLFASIGMFIALGATLERVYEKIDANGLEKKGLLDFFRAIYLVCRKEGNLGIIILITIFLFFLAVFLLILYY